MPLLWLALAWRIWVDAIDLSFTIANDVTFPQEQHDG